MIVCGCSGTCGEVLPSGAVSRAAAEAAFRLVGPPGAPPGAKLAAAAVRAAVLAPPRARRAALGAGGGPGTFIASFEHAEGAQVVPQNSLVEWYVCSLHGAL